MRFFMPLPFEGTTGLFSGKVSKAGSGVAGTAGRREHPLVATITTISNTEIGTNLCRTSFPILFEIRAAPTLPLVDQYSLS
jgi:hypothetical protein